MDFFTWLPSFERVKRQPRDGSWVGGKFYIESDFSLAESDKNSLLDFFGNHVDEEFVYFTKQREEKANLPEVFAYDTNFVLVEDQDRVQLWANGETITDEEVASGQDSVTVSYNLPQAGTIRFAFEYVGDGDYVKIICPDGSYVRIYIENSLLIGEARQANRSSVLKVDNITVWNSPNVIMGSVISFALSWTFNKILFAHNGIVKSFDFGFSFRDAEVDCLQNTYDVIVFDVPLETLLQFFHLPFEEFTTVNATDYTVSVSDYPFLVAGRVGFKTKFSQSMISFYKAKNSENYVANRIIFQEL